MSIRVAIADDHPVVRSGIKNELVHSGEVNVIGEAIDGNEALALVEELRPDVLILDLNMPGLRTTDILRKINNSSRGTHVLILTAHKDEENVIMAIRAGAKGYILKDEEPETIVRAVKAVAAGKRWLSTEIAEILYEQIAEDEKQKRDNALTAREMEALKYLAQGFNNQEIASALSISERTARFHVDRIVYKLRAKNRTEAVFTASKQGLV